VSLTQSIFFAGLIVGGPATAQTLDRPDRQDTSTEAAPTPAPVISKPPTVELFVQAEYPEGARTQGIEATVGLIIALDTSGAVTNVRVAKPADHGFDEAAVEAVKAMRFSPAESADGPVDVTIEFDYNFTLSVDEKAAGPPAVNLEGSVRRMGDRALLPDVQIQVRIDGVSFTARTDETGHYRFRGLPPGMAFLYVVTPEYKAENQNFRIKENRVTTANIWLLPNVRGDGSQSINEEMLIESARPEPDITRRTITAREIQRIPGTFGDPVRVIQNLPGTARAPFGTGMVVVRGSNPEDTSFYVDGIRVPLIYHLGGLVSIVNEDLVGSVEYLPGGFGVEYGRSTGGVINIRTSQDYPERFRAEVSVDLLDISGVVQGRVGKEKRWGLTAAGRRSYLDAFVTPLAGGAGFNVKPFWWDYQFKLDDLSKTDGKFAVMMLGFGDKLYFGSPDDVAQGTDQDTQGDADVHYGAHRIIAQYNQKFDDTLTTRLTPSIGYDTIGFGLGNEFKFDQWSWIVEFRGDLLWSPKPWLTLRPGLDVLGGPYKVEITLPFDPATLAAFDPIEEREDYTNTFDGTFWSIDPFVEAWLKPLDGSDKLKLIPGVRFNTLALPYYSIFSVDPRFSVRYSPWEDTTFKAGTGLYHQPPQGPDLGFNETDIQVDFERSLATEIGVEHQFSEAIEADLTFFYKRLDELIVENENIQSNSDPYFVNGGQGRVRGMEVMVRHNPIGNLFGWVSYTLSSAERYQVPVEDRGKTRPSESDEWRPFEYDQTHILVALAGYNLPKDWGVSGRFRYVTGNPHTPYDGAIYDIDRANYLPFQVGETMSERLPPFYALDLRVDKRYTFKRWWLETYVDLLNVLSGENPEEQTYNYDYTESAYIRGLPFIPSIGLRAEYAF
jgi:TonB family protein